MGAEAWENFEFEPEPLGQLMYKRAIGEMPEMECSKATCEVLKPLYKQGMKVLDVGCNVGHYLRSFRERLDHEIDYTGDDPTPRYIEWANEVFRPSANFKVGNVYELQFEDDSFDIVICNNVLLNLPPPLTEPFAELLRVTRKVLVFRTLVSSSIHICMKSVTLEGESLQAVDMIKEDGSLVRFNYRNMYPVEYFEGLMRRLQPGCEFEMFRDTMWSGFDNKADIGGCVDGTQTSGSFQRSEELIFDWHFGVVVKT